MGILEDQLASLAADNSEPGVTFAKTPPGDPTTGRKVVSMEELNAIAFPSQSSQTVAPLPPPVSQSSQTATPQIQTQQSIPDFAASLKKQVDDMQTAAAGDPDKLIDGIATIRGSVAAKEAEMLQEAMALQRAKYGIGDIEKQIAINQQKDNQPWFRQRYGMVDSAETAHYKEELASMQRMADAGAKEMLTANPAYAQLKAYSDALLTKTARLEERDYNAKEDLRRKGEQLIGSLSEEQQKRFADATGLAQGDPNFGVNAVYKFTLLAKNPKLSKQLTDFLEAPTDAIPSLILQKNPWATQAAIKSEASVIGGPEALKVATQKINEIQDIASDSGKAWHAFQFLKEKGALSTLVPPGGKEQEYEREVQALLDPKRAAKISGMDKDRATGMMIRIAQEYARTSTQLKFSSDVSNFDQPPTWLTAAKNIPLFSGKVSENDAIALANSAPTPQERQQRMGELKNYYTAAVDKQNQSSFFQLRPLAAERFVAKAGLSPFDIVKEDIGKIGTALGRVMTGIGRTALVPGSLMYEVANAEPGLSPEELRSRIFQRAYGKNYISTSEPVKGNYE